jgi:hypothetical protein
MLPKWIVKLMSEERARQRIPPVIKSDKLELRIAEETLKIASPGYQESQSDNYQKSY